MPVRFLLPAGLLLGVALLAGCKTIHDVTVDAISDRTKPLGASYHLEVNDPTGGVEPEVHNLAIATIKDALAARGLYEVPASTRPDMMIEASYAKGHGQIKIVTDRNTEAVMGTSMMPVPTSKAVVVFEKSLELTAREPDAAPAAGAPQRGAELWSVKTKIVDTKQEIANYLPALASACIDYIGENPGRELVLPVEDAQAQVLLQQRPAARGGADPAPQNR